jgi:hypothetical protein
MTRTLTLLAYAAVVATGVGLEIAARRGRNYATFGEALSVAMRRRPVRLLVLTASLWLGWHLFVRVDWA